MIKFGYWNCSGLLEPILLFCDHKNLEYQVTRYENQQEFEQDPIFQQLNFPSLPYMVDLENVNQDNFSLSNTLAILKYLSRKTQIVLSNEQQALADNLETVLREIKQGWVQITYMQANQNTWIKNVGLKKFQQVNQFMDRHADIFSSEHYNFPFYYEFYLFELVSWHLKIDDAFLNQDELAHLQNWYENMKKFCLPRRRAGLKINNSMAHWNQVL